MPRPMEHDCLNVRSCFQPEKLFSKNNMPVIVLLIVRKIHNVKILLQKLFLCEYVSYGLQCLLFTIQAILTQAPVKILQLPASNCNSPTPRSLKLCAWAKVLLANFSHLETSTHTAPSARNILPSFLLAGYLGNSSGISFPTSSGILSTRCTNGHTRHTALFALCSSNRENVY